MTRPIETGAEKRAQFELFAHLFNQGQKVSKLNRTLQDRPDLAFECEGDIIACECVQFPTEKILQWEHKRRTNFLTEDGKVKAVGTIWPIEVHSWVKEAIEKKAGLYQIYKRSVSANAVWLFVHCHSDNFLENIYSDNTLLAARYGAQCASHMFERIYFFDVRCGVNLIYEPGMPQLKIEHNLAEGYPAMTTIQYSGAPFTTTSGETDEPNIYEYNVEETHTVIVKPIDREYRARGVPAVRIRPAKRIRIRAYHDRAEQEIIFE